MNPHVYFYINVKDASGKITNWALEMGQPPGFQRQGWTKNTLQIGDTVKVEGSLARNGTPLANARNVFKDGKKMGAASSEGQDDSGGDPMRSADMRALRLDLSLSALCLRAVASTAQEGHPLKGSWVGTWGPSQNHADDVLIVMNWDGKAISGHHQPGHRQHRDQERVAQRPWGGSCTSRATGRTSRASRSPT